MCESESFIPQGLKAAKDACKKKNPVSVSGGRYVGSSAAHDGTRSQKRENPNRSKQSKHSGSINSGNISGRGGGNQNNGSGHNNWGLRRSEASVWLLLINKLSKMSLLPVCLYFPKVIFSTWLLVIFENNRAESSCRFKFSSFSLLA